MLLLASREEHGLRTAEEDIQAFAFDRDPRSVFYWFVCLVFFVHEEGNHSDKYSQTASGNQGTVCHPERGGWVFAWHRDKGAGEGHTCIIPQSEVQTEYSSPAEGSSHSQQARAVHVHLHRVTYYALGHLAGGVRNDSADLCRNGSLAGHHKVHHGVTSLWHGRQDICHLDDVNL